MEGGTQLRAAASAGTHAKPHDNESPLFPMCILLSIGWARKLATIITLSTQAQVVIRVLRVRDNGFGDQRYAAGPNARRDTATTAKFVVQSASDWGRRVKGSSFTRPSTDYTEPLGVTEVLYRLISHA